MADKRNLKSVEDWTEGDFELVSSDGYIFRVASHHVLAASTVLSDANGLSTSSTGRIELDDDFEDGETLRHFLSLLTTGNLDIPSWREDAVSVITPLVGLLNFLDKWDCRPSIAALKNIMQLKMAQGEVEACTVFAIAAMTDNLELCEEVVKWEAKTIRKGEIATLNPATFSQRMWDMIPSTYLRALTQSYIEISVPVSNKFTPPTASCELFKKRLEAAKQAATPSP